VVARPRVEAELKFSIDPAVAARLPRSPVIVALRCGPAVTRQLRTIYFDTPDLALDRLGVALRVRRTAEGWIQTVKSGGGAAGGLHARLEAECRVPGPLPLPDALAGAAAGSSAAARRLRSARVRNALQPVFETRFRRTAIPLETVDGDRIELAIDRGWIVAGNRRLPLSEIELECIAGRATALFDVGLQLAARLPLQVEDRSKAERGFRALRSTESSAPIRAEPVALDGRGGARLAFLAIGRSALAHLTANRAGMLSGDDIEYLHQMRVALRRLRSLFGTFAPHLQGFDLRPVVAEFRWLGSLLGPARDWDVFLAEAAMPALDAIARERGVRVATAAWDRRRMAATRAARAAVLSPRYTGLVLAAGRLFAAVAAAEAGPGRDVSTLRFARVALDRARKTVERRGRGIGRQSDEQLHRLRVAVKKLRYAVEFFAPLFPAARVKPYRTLLAGLQDCLGTINDGRAVQTLAASAGPGSAVFVARVQGFAAGRAHAERGRLPKLRKAFVRARRFW
jgi:inorganic triphosphatase YgiF